MSAVDVGCLIVSAAISRGEPAPSVVRPAAVMAWRKSRRESSELVISHFAQSGRRSTLSAHSCCSLQWATSRISFTMSPMCFGWSRITNTPGMGSPVRTRSYAKSGMVFWSWVRRIRPSEAAQARMSGSAAVLSPTS